MKAMTVRGFDRDALLRMDIDSLRGILHMVTHHTIETNLYMVLGGTLKIPKDFGKSTRFILDIWKERGLPTDTPDLKWVQLHVDLVEKIANGENVELDTKYPEPFTREEMQAVDKLIFSRRSIRQFKPDPVPEEMIEKILYAGLMSPQACNVDARRFIVLRDLAEMKLLQSDIRIENGLMIVVCQDMRVYKTLKFDVRVPQNIYYDAASAADHICLMAHAFGLGACWLTHGLETQKKVRENLGLHEDIVSRCHIILGWPDEAPIKSERMRLQDAIIVNSHHR